jgi:hypothetical protein
MQPALEIRVANIFDVAQAFRQTPNRPGMMPQHSLPMLHENDEKEYNKEADSQGWPENLHSTCFRGPL